MFSESIAELLTRGVHVRLLPCFYTPSYACDWPKLTLGLLIQPQQSSIPMLFKLCICACVNTRPLRCLCTMSGVAELCLLLGLVCSFTVNEYNHWLEIQKRKALPEKGNSTWMVLVILVSCLIALGFYRRVLINVMKATSAAKTAIRAAETASGAAITATVAANTSVANVIVCTHAAGTAEAAKNAATDAANTVTAAAKKQENLLVPTEHDGPLIQDPMP